MLACYCSFDTENFALHTSQELITIKFLQLFISFKIVAIGTVAIPTKFSLPI